MTTLTLQYDDRKSIFTYLVGAFLQAGAKIVEPKEKVVSEQEKVLAAYQKIRTRLQTK